MEYVMRRAREEDLESLVSFTLAEAREAQGIELDPSVVRRGVKAGLSDPAVAMYWVIESEPGAIVAGTSVVREWSDWNALYYWWIQSMYVSPDHRRRGLADKLIDEVLAEARGSDAVELRLYVHQENGRAIRAYHRCGFGDLPYRVMARNLG